MRSFVGALLIAACFVACTHGFPGASRETSDSSEGDDKKNVDTVLVLPQGTRNRFGRPVMEFPMDSSEADDSTEGLFTPGYFNPFNSNPFDGFLTRMQDVMNRLREQMAGILSRIPEQGVLGPWGKIPEGGNTTSTTKIINGHVVTINETVLKNDDDNDFFDSVFRIRVIEIKPLNETSGLPDAGGEVEDATKAPGGDAEETEREGTTPARSIETVEELDNEIPKSQGELTA